MDTLSHCQTAFNRNAISMGLNCKGFLISPVERPVVCERISGKESAHGPIGSTCKLLPFFFFRVDFKSFPPGTKGSENGVNLLLYSDASPTTGAKVRQHRWVGTEEMWPGEID